MIALPTFRGALAGFNPRSLSPALWLSDTGSDPSVWTDISGNGRDASQGDPAKRPSIVTGALNGRQVRRFDGADDFFSLTTGLGMLRNVPGATIIVAYKWITNPTTFSPVFLASTQLSGTTSRSVLGGGITSRKLVSGGRRLDTDASFAGATSVSDNPTTYFVHSGVLDYANSNAYQYVNGSLDGENTSFQTDGNTDTTDSNAILIGANGVSGFCNIDIAEILVFPTALSATNRQRVERYLAGKYAITI
jgi:hypothetical protein